MVTVNDELVGFPRTLAPLAAGTRNGFDTVIVAPLGAGKVVTILPVPVPIVVPHVSL
jgi:hypothetical protein